MSTWFNVQKCYVITRSIDNDDKILCTTINKNVAWCKIEDDINRFIVSLPEEALKYLSIFINNKYMSEDVLIEINWDIGENKPLLYDTIDIGYRIEESVYIS